MPSAGIPELFDTRSESPLFIAASDPANGGSLLEFLINLLKVIKEASKHLDA
jgi:hypothetical protein